MNKFILALNMFEVLNPVLYTIGSTITFIFPLEEHSMKYAIWLVMA